MGLTETLENHVFRFLIGAFCAGFGACITIQHTAGLDCIHKNTYILVKNAVTKEQYEALKKQYEQYRDTKSIGLQDLPPRLLAPTRGEMVKNIHMVTDIVDDAKTVHMAFARVAGEIARNAKINTARSADNLPSTMLYEHVQRLLNALNDRPVQESGRSTDALQAVQQFQRRHGLTQDGVIGAKTWERMTVEYFFMVQQILGNHNGNPARAASSSEPNKGVQPTK